jgi:hypothetical protein
MTRRTLTPLFILGALTWAAAPRAAVAASSDTSMPVQVAGLSLGTESPAPIAPSPAGRAKANAVAGVFSPAPMPDQDVDPPAGSSARGPSLSPALFSHKEEFAGDGFAAASDADHGLDHRRAPAAGLNWSVPVK